MGIGSVSLCGASHMHDDFDHRSCPACEQTMRLGSVEPRNVLHEHDFENHTYVCDTCGNVSRFVFEVPSRTPA